MKRWNAALNQDYEFSFTNRLSELRQRKEARGKIERPEPCRESPPKKNRSFSIWTRPSETLNDSPSVPMRHRTPKIMQIRPFVKAEQR